MQSGVENTVRRGQGPGAGHSFAGSTCDFGSNLASVKLLLQLGNLEQNQVLPGPAEECRWGDVEEAE